ncbi:MAG: NAD(P)/FAD-dependent oxidoreductase [Candidatus Omnitrophica bacterium]|nr:NAD(P)/FAD-dependent oxidoreductase [Candidatus Omnitrophota bacterium]
MQKRLVVIGNGMAGARVVEEILKRAPGVFEIVMFGAEPYGNYNRILLSNVLNQSQKPEEIFLNSLTWYQGNNIRLHAGVKAVKIDAGRRCIIGYPLPADVNAYDFSDGLFDKDATVIEPYDNVIIATGSRPFVPPIEGQGLPGVFLFRTIDDCRRIAEFAHGCRKAAVIGGGLLGLEAARGLLTHNVDVTVVEAGGQLMNVQLDEESGQMLRRTMEAMGITVVVNGRTKRIREENGKITGLEFQDGTSIDADMVVISAGIRPITEIAQVSGITVNKGIVCDDHMRTNVPEIFALGECVEHRGKIYGLVDPIWEQARVLADVITGTNSQARYEGSKTATKLKVMGVELVSIGAKDAEKPSDELVVYRELKRNIYKKVVIRDEKILGAILLGDTEYADTLMRMFLAEQKIPGNPSELLFGTVTGSALVNAADLPDNAQICNCNGVCKKEIVDAIVNDNCQSVSAVGAKTKAGKGCGSCRSMIAQIIESCVGKVSYDASEHYYVPGIPLEKSQLVAQILTKKLRSVSAVFAALADGKEDADSKVGLASLLKTLWPGEYEDERDARFINDRVHANIQRDGTFSVIPRVYAGVTTPDELMRIAQAAVKYQVKMVKITGGQRIDLLGIQKADLPAIWKDLGMPSGHAYTKAFRTCKSCVGTDFCRFGLGDSIQLAQNIERRFQGIESPHKMKLATAGCPRNCSEAYVKDIGAVAVGEDKWEIYIGGAAGGTVRKGDFLYTAQGHEETVKVVGRFMQYYREHAKYLERTYGFVERVGIDVLKNILVGDSLGICAQLDARIQEAVDAYRDPWKEAEVQAYERQFEGPRLVEVLREAENNG